jgi:hypothetical protein
MFVRGSTFADTYLRTRAVQVLRMQVMSGMIFEVDMGP